MAREQAASARYRKQEETLNFEQIPIPVESNVGNSSSSSCVLLVLVLYCFLLSLSVQALCGAVLSLVKKENER